MPSLGIHLVVLDEMVQKLKSSAEPTSAGLAELLEKHPAEAALGAIGPDLLYYDGTGPKFVGLVSDVFRFVNPLKIVLEDAAHIAGVAGMPNLKNFLDSVGQLKDTVFAVGQASIVTVLVELNNFVTREQIAPVPGIQTGKPEADWKWGDILHWRSTGRFASTICETARQTKDSALFAYGCGYKTHMVTDTVGHPFVNTVSGGPSRCQPMRHTLAEKFMDAHVFSQLGRDINTSALNTRISALEGSAVMNTISATLFDQMKSVQQGAAAGAFPLNDPPDVDDIEDALTTMLRLFEFVTNDNYVAPPKRPAMAFPPLPFEAGSISNAIGGLAPPGGKINNLADLFKALLFALLLAPAIIADLIKFVADCAFGLIAYPVECAMFLLQSYLYKLYRSIRRTLVYSGVVFPLQDELSDSFAHQFLFTSTRPDENYPHLPYPFKDWKEIWNTGDWGDLEIDFNNQPYFYYPATPPERPLFWASQYLGVTAADFIRGSSFVLNPAFINLWSNAKTPQDIPVTKMNQLKQLYGFGNAVDLSVYYMFDSTLFENANLDSDRGYGFKNWRCTSGLGSGQLSNIHFI